MREISIVGGGLAGLALGIALRRRDVPVRLFEAGTYPRHRVCGEFLCGVSDATLNELGVRNLLDGATRLTNAAWYHASGCALRHDLPVPARGISRHRLDDALARRFREAGGILQENERLSPDQWSRPGTIVATGRVPAPDSRLIGLKLHLRGMPLESDLEMHCAPGGYIGLCPVDDGRVNASALFRLRPDLKAPRDQLQRRYLEACGLHDLVARMDQAEVDPESCAAVSGVSTGRFRPASDPAICAIGDRFGMIGPFTGNGMSMAFESAHTAAPLLADYAGGRLEWAQAIPRIQRLQERRFRKRLFLSALLHRALLHPRTLPLLATVGNSGLFPVRFLFHQLR